MYTYDFACDDRLDRLPLGVLESCPPCPAVPGPGPGREGAGRRDAVK